MLKYENEIKSVKENINHYEIDFIKFKNPKENSSLSLKENIKYLKEVGKEIRNCVSQKL